MICFFGDTLPLSHQQIRPATHRNTEKERHLVEGIGREWGWGRSQMVRQRENLVLYKSFNTLWLVSTCLQFSLSRMSKMKTFRFKNKLRTESVQLPWVAVLVSCEVSLPDQNKILKIASSTGAKMILVKTWSKSYGTLSFNIGSKKSIGPIPCSIFLESALFYALR